MTIPIPCPCGATVHANTYPDGVTHTTVCECGRRVHVNVEIAPSTTYGATA